MQMNIPNKLTLARVIFIPIFMFFIIFPVFGKIISPIVAAVLFILIALTDLLDGRIARKYNLVTDFGKFLDPLADKLLIFGALLAVVSNIGYRGTETEYLVFSKILVWSAFIIFLRELAVTSMRLVVSSNANIVVAAGWLGKIKTVSQMVCIVALLVEPVFSENVLNTHNILGYLTLAVSVTMTIVSGLSYFKAYWPYINSNK